MESLAPLLFAATQPGRPGDLALWIEFLLSRYTPKPDAPAFADMDKRIWLRVLGHWPTDVMEAAVTAWCEEKRAFKPQVPGEVKPLGEPILAERRALLARAECIIQAPAVAPPIETRAERANVVRAVAARLGLGRRGEPDKAQPVNNCPVKQAPAGEGAP